MIAATVTTNTTGLKAITEFVQQRDVTLKGAKAAGKIVAKAAKAGAPKVSGALKTAIGVKTVKGSADDTGSLAIIGARKKISKMVVRPGRRKPVKAVPAFYLHLIEKGTQPHAVGKGSRVARKGRATVASGGKHPGTAPRPFLGPAFQATKADASDAALKAMGEETQRQIEKIASKMRDGLGGM